MHVISLGLSMNKIKKELTKEQLTEVTGGADQMEEFDWNAPTRKRTSSVWSFSAEANADGQFFKKNKSEIIELDDNDN